MHAKRLFAAEVLTSPLSVLRRIAYRNLMALCIAATGLTAAHAAPIQIWVEPQRLFNYGYGNTAQELAYFDTPEAAFANYRSFYDKCSGTNPVTCTSSSNLRPYDGAPPSTNTNPTLNILYNGVSYWHEWDRTVCQGNSCTTTTGGMIQQQLICPQGTNPTWNLTGIGGDIYDRRFACVFYIYSDFSGYMYIEPCPDCDGKGNPIHPGTGQKFQVETDYIGAGGLQFQRTYRSSNGGFFSSPATSSLLDNSVAVTFQNCFPGIFTDGYGQIHSKCYRYVATGTPNYNFSTPDGRIIAFTGPLNAITAKADINERLTQRTGASGAIEWVLKRADDSTEIYNAQGSLIRKTSLSGRDDVLYAYSDAATPPAIAPRSGLLIRMTDRFGRQLNFTYDAASRMTMMTDPAGAVFQYAYDALGNLSSVTYPDGTVRLYHYNEAANINNGAACSGGTPAGGTPGGLRRALTGITENGARFSTFKYDCYSRAVSTEHAGGIDKHSFTYGGAGQFPNAVELDPLGTARTYSYRQILGVARPTGTTQPAVSGTGTVSNSIVYNANGSVTQRADFNGNTSTYTYDLARNLETQRKEGLTAAGANTPQTRTINTQWHPSFRQPTKIAEPLRITTYIYNGDAGASCGTGLDGSLVPGVLCSKTVQATTDANGSLGFSATLTGTPRTWSYTYNANGKVLTANGPRTDVSDITTYTYYADDDADLGKRGNVATITNALGHRVDITQYNAHGQPTEIIDANAMVTTLTYDARQRLTSRNVGGEVTSYDYDPVGQLIKVTLPDGSHLNYGYDAGRRLTEVSDNLGNRIVYTLDNAGNRTSEEVRDPANVLAQKRSRVYNALNRLFRDLGAQNQTTEYAYDNQGNLTSVKDPLNQITANQYDALNRLVQVTDPGSGLTKYEYNGLNALTKVTDPRNLATNYTLTGLGNLTSQISPDTGTTANTYDAAGNLATQTDAKGQLTTYTYDALHRVISATFHDGSKHVYGYDAGTNGIGRLTTINELNQAQTVIGSMAYAYDQKGRITSDTRTINGVAYSTGYRYDSFGRLDRITYPSGRTVDYTFDSLGRISAVSTTPAGGSASNLATDITYHPFGGVRSYTLGNGQTYARTYDQDGRITSYTLGSSTYSVGYDVASRIGSIAEVGNPANANTYGYDVLDRLTTANTPGTNYAYAYDAVGNRTSKTVGAGSETYAYSATSNRIATITPASGPVRSFAFDPNGSTTADGLNTYGYDVRRRMTSANSSIGTTNYQLNALGQRVRKTNSLVDVVFIYDSQGHLLVESATAGVVIKEYVWLHNTPLAVMDSVGSYFIHPDHINTPRLLANPTGSTVWQWSQSEPFGSNPANENPSGLGIFDLPLRLPGQYFDKESNLTYNYFRDYDSAIGRYIRSDPLGLLAGLNTYAYVLSRPLISFDPTGLCPWCLPGLGGTEWWSRNKTNSGTKSPSDDNLLPPPGKNPSAGGLPDWLKWPTGMNAESSDDTKQCPVPVPADPKDPPGPDWEWRGKGDPGTDKGSWYNPGTGESMHPDLKHPEPVGPHWDYTDPSGKQWRVDPGSGMMTPK
jgi:RHS repeat-associated protein